MNTAPGFSQNTTVAKTANVTLEDGLSNPRDRLVASPDLFRALDRLPVGFCLKDENGRYLYVNPAYSEACNVAPEKLIGQSDDPSAVIAAEGFSDRDGVSEVVMRDDFGVPQGTAGVLAGANADLGRESMLKKALNCTRQVVWSCSGPEYRLAFGSGIAEYIVCEAASVPGTLDGWLELVDYEDRSQVETAFMQCLSGKSNSFSIEFRMRSGQNPGEQRWMSMTGELCQDHRSGDEQLVGVIREITHGKMREIVITSGLDALDDVFVFAKDSEFRFTFVNEPLAKIFGVPRSEIIGKTDADLNPDSEQVQLFIDDDKKILEGENAAVLGGTIHFKRQRIAIAEERLTDSLGVTHVLATIKVPLQMPDGSVQMLGVARAIRKMEHVREKIEHYDALLLLDHLIDSVDDVIYFKDTKGRFLRVNNAMAELAGVSSAEMEGKTDYDFFPSAFADTWRLEEQLIVELGRPIVNNICLNRRNKGDGSDRTRLVSKFPVRNENGTVIGLIGIGRDITDFPKVEQKVIVDSESLDRVLANTSQYVFIKDDLGRYLNCNSQFAARHGLMVAEVRNKTDFDFWPREQALRFRRDDARVMDEKRAMINYEEWQEDNQGNRSMLITTKMPLLDNHGRVVALLGIYEVVPPSIGDHTRVKEEIAASIASLRRAMTERRASSRRS